jgi:hypothetical protein
MMHRSRQAAKLFIYGTPHYDRGALDRQVGNYVFEPIVEQTGLDTIETAP